MTALRYEIQIINPADGKPKRWDVYESRERAESILRTLTKHGFYAVIRRVDVDVLEAPAITIASAP